MLAVGSSSFSLSSRGGTYYNKFVSPKLPSTIFRVRCCTSQTQNHIFYTTADTYGKLGNAKTLLKGMLYPELEDWAKSYGFRPGQAMMLWKCLYANDNWAQNTDEMEGLNKQFLTTIERSAQLSILSLKDVHCASDGTRKILFSLEDGLVVETVVIPCDTGRTTICVSSQAGCAMNCQFCFTGRMGLKRNLSTAEIVEQAVYARRLFTNEVGPLTNVVFMGMGEPLHNYENVLKAVNIMVHGQGLHFSPRKVTVSTSGLVPQIKKFIRESPCALAVSLNATTDEVRNWIMPINRKYNLDMLLTTLREEISRRHKYKVFFEYIMLAGINDSLDDARRLAKLVNRIPCKVNLLYFNRHDGSPFISSSSEQISLFHKVLVDEGIASFIRPSRGNDQMAACGQLGSPGDIQPPRIKVPQRFQEAFVADVTSCV